MTRMKILVTGIMVVGLVGCGGVGVDSATGGDGARGDAAEIPVNATLDDRLSAEEGDHTDWKRFTVDSDREVTIQVWWDNPNVSARVSLRDELGKEIASVAHKGGSRTDELGPKELGEGVYYLEFSASAGSSVYTFEVRSSRTGPILPDL